MEAQMPVASTPRRLMSDRRARQLVGVVGAAALVMLADPAYAGTEAITSGINTIQKWIMGISTVVCTIAVIFVGYSKLTGRMDWGKAIAVLTGIGIIFSASTIVSWMSSAGG